VIVWAFCAGLNVKESVVDCANPFELAEPGAVAVIVIWELPVATVVAALNVSVLPVEEFVGANAAVTPVGKPVAAKLTLALKPFAGATVIAVLTLCPAVSARLIGLALRLKLAPAVMTSVTVVAALVDPEVPVIVSG
jgi:hypothetical protein